MNKVKIYLKKKKKKLIQTHVHISWKRKKVNNYLIRKKN